MKQERFEALYASQWQEFETLLSALESKKKNREKTGMADFPRLYRRVCQYLSLAQERQYSAYLVDHLNDLVLRGHHHLYRFKSGLRHRFFSFLVAGFPQLVRDEWRFVIWAMLLLYVPALVLFVLTQFEPSLVFSIMDPAQVTNFEDMYNPQLRHIGRERDSDTDFMMFGHYIYNNIGIAFRCFASGLLVMVGSLFFLLFNGMLFGAVAGHLTHIGYAETFFTFVIAHGSFELTAIGIAGAAGMRIGYSLLSPGRLSRLAALKSAAMQAVQLMYGVILMLLIAAFIEAFWSSTSALPAMVKYSVGAILWLLVILYFCLSGRSREA